MSTYGKIRSLAATLRLPNLPSVWSNTLTGIIFACMIQDQGSMSQLPWALLTASCLYFAGNLFNDWADRSWDKEHRPERALPSGLFKPTHYLILGILLVIIGLTAAALSSTLAFFTGLALTFFILIYTWIHKKTAWGVVPMALCRASLPILGYVYCIAEWHRSAWIFLPSALLFSYLIMLSLRARCESRPSNSALLPWLTGAGFLLPPIILIICSFLPIASKGSMLVLGVAAAPYLIWTAMALSVFRSPIPRQISALLAGIPLLDALFLLPYALMGYLDVNQPAAIWLAMAWAPAFMAGRLLQRYVPAT